MTDSRQNRIAHYNRNLLRYLAGEVWKRKWSFLVAAIVGAGLATLSVYLNPPRYVAKATFVSDLPILAREIQRLESRDLLRAAVGKLNHLQVRSYSKGRLGRESDFYDKSPVAIAVRSFPDHLRDVEMRLDFSEGYRYGLTFEAQGEKVEAQGEFGKPLQVGSIQLLISPTKFWSERFLGETVWFQLRALDGVAAQVAANYLVENLNHRKNRIAVFYTDENPDRAFDVLNSVCQEAMIGYQDEVQSMLKSRMGNLEDKMDILLAQMIDDENLAQILHHPDLREKNRDIDSLVIALQTLNAEKNRLRNRDSLLRDLAETGFVEDGFREVFSFNHLSPADSALLEDLDQRDRLRLDSTKNLDDLRAINVRIDQLANSILVADSMEMMDLDNRKAKIENWLMTNVSLRKTFVSASIDRRNADNQGVMIWEAYLEVAQDRYQLESEITRQAEQFELIESPYVVNQARRFIQIRKIVSGGLLGALLVLTWVLVAAFGGSRVRSTQHLQVVSALPFAAVVRDRDNKMAARRLHIALEMERKPGEKIISVVGHLGNQEQSDLVDELAARFKASGQRAMVFRDDLAGMNPDDSAPTDMSVHLLSRVRDEQLTAAADAHDVVIQQLPPLREFPESWYPAMATKHLIYLLQANAATVEELRELEEKMKKHQLRVYLYFGGE